MHGGGLNILPNEFNFGNNVDHSSFMPDFVKARMAEDGGPFFKIQ